MSATATQPAPVKGDPQALVNEALNRLTTIGTLPEVTVRIIRTVEDPKSSASQLNDIVSHDPALVTRILKVVNSSFYGLPGQIASVERAIVLLGLNGVKNLAVAASLGHLFRGVKLCEPFTARDLWHHCIAVAVAARELANRHRLPVADEAFLAGMIHDIGMLAHLQLWPEKLREVCLQVQHSAAEGQPTDFCELERKIIGVDHQLLGAGLAQRWRFPQSCQHVAGKHHNPVDGGELLVGLVNIADTLCCQIKLGFNLTALNQKVEETHLNSLGLSKAVYDQVVANLPERVSAAITVFS